MGRENLCVEVQVIGAHRAGGYAEYIVVPERNLLHKPANLSFEEAAAFPLVFLTAWHMLMTRARLQPGEWVLVMGGGSGVGSAAIQIAKLRGALVIATAGSDAKLQRCRELGADCVVNHNDPDWHKQVREATEGEGIDVVFEHVGQAVFDACIKLLTKGGRLVTCGATTGGEARFDIRYVFSASWRFTEPTSARAPSWSRFCPTWSTDACARLWTAYTTCRTPAPRTRNSKAATFSAKSCCACPKRVHYRRCACVNRDECAG
jgi:NADPH:quinone reductase-like Zn-dependent oxidoreductase